MDKDAEQRKYAMVFLGMAVKSNHVAWYGWELHRSGYWYEKEGHKKEGLQEHKFQGVRKIFGGHHPLQITLRRESIVPWNNDFDASEHPHWFHIEVEDLLGICGFRKLVDVYIDENDPEFSEVFDTFKTLYETANVIQGGKNSGKTVGQIKQAVTTKLIEELAKVA